MLKNKKQKGFSKIVILLVALVVVIVGIIFFNLPKTAEQNQIETKIDGWQIYRSEEYGFEVEYPGNWSFVEYPNIESVGFSENPIPEGSNRGINSVSIWTVGEGDENEIISELDKVKIERNIKINGNTATKISGVYKDTGSADLYTGLKTVNAFVSNRSYSYGIFFDEQFKGDTANLDIFEKMLSTFKFID